MICFRFLWVFNQKKSVTLYEKLAKKELQGKFNKMLFFVEFSGFFNL